MLTYLIQGFILGLAYVAPIGMQNMYVINSAIRLSRFKALQVALIIIFFDISLAIACFLGIGLLLEKMPLFQAVMLFIGSLAVSYFGLRLILTKPTEIKEVKTSESIFKVVMLCFVVTWFNPQAVIDGSLLLGSFKASLPALGSNLFIIGVALASFIWFTSLSLITSIFRQKISLKILRLINLISGIILIIFGLKLGWEFYKLITL